MNNAHALAEYGRNLRVMKDLMAEVQEAAMNVLLAAGGDNTPKVLEGAPDLEAAIVALAAVRGSLQRHEAITDGHLWVEASWATCPACGERTDGGCSVSPDHACRC